VSQFVRNTLVSAVETVSLIIAAIITTPLILHALGDARYGLFVFISMFSITGVLSFLDFGMEGALMTAIAKAAAVNDQPKLSGMRRAGIWYYTSIGIVIGAAITIFLKAVAGWMQVDVSSLGSASLWGMSLAAGMNVALQFMAVPYVAHAQGLQRFVGIKLVNVALNIFQYGVITVIAIGSQRIDLIIITIATISALRVAIFGYLSHRMLRVSTPVAPLGTYLRDLSQSSSWLLGNRVVGLVYNNTHKGLISAGLPIANLGVFDVISRPASFFRVLLSMLYSAVIPKSASLTSRSERDGLSRLFVQITSVASVVLLPVGCWLIGQSRNILSLWIGPEYAIYSLALQLLICAGILNVVTSIVSTMAVGMEIVPKTIKIAVSVTLANLIASIVCIPIFGVTGASIALCIAEGIGLPMTLALISNELPGSLTILKGSALRLTSVAAIAVLMQLMLGSVTSLSDGERVIAGIGLGMIHGIIGLMVLSETIKNPLFESIRRISPMRLKKQSVVS
jgi:O-antigen/teichoic acid export membrane protein